MSTSKRGRRKRANRTKMGKVYIYGLIMATIFIMVIIGSVVLIGEGKKQEDKQIQIIESADDYANTYVQDDSKRNQLDEPETVIEEEVSQDEILCLSREEEANQILSVMSLEEKVYQMFIVLPEQLTGIENVTAAGDITRQSIEKYPVGGIIYLSGNLQNKSQTTEMLHNTQAYAMEIEGVPLFLCVDEEGGRVLRIGNNPGFSVDKTGPMIEIDSEEEAYGTGNKIGAYLSDLGFNVDFAPDADVLTNKDNQVIGDRSFGTDADKVRDCAVAYARGLQENGILSTFKHFPGHGATMDDTHQGFAYTDKTIDELMQAELVPFLAANDAGIDMIMVAHMSVPSIINDNTPCTLSPFMIKELLRGELGYEGLVVTDAMNMGAITSVYSNRDAVIRAVNAGADLILAPTDFRGGASAIVEAVNRGDIEEGVIDNAVRRILIKKLEMMNEE